MFQNLKDFILLFYFTGNLNCSSVDLAQILSFFPLFFNPQSQLSFILYVTMNTIIWDRNTAKTYVV